MKKKKFTKSNAPRSKGPKEPLGWKYCLVTIFFGALLATGFFFAASQHFNTMNYGFRNNELRNRIEELKAANRKLKLNKEIALSPRGIKEAARKLGLTGTTVRNLAPAGDVPEATQASLPVEEAAAESPIRTYIKVDKEKPVQKSAPAARQRPAEGPRVVKTGKSTPAAPVVETAEKKEDPAKSTRSRVIDTTAKR